MHALSHDPFGSWLPQHLLVPGFAHSGWQAIASATHPAEQPCAEVGFVQQCSPLAHPVEATFKMVHIWLSPGLSGTRPFESQPLINLGVKKPG
jgi:hypothetical protein